MPSIKQYNVKLKALRNTKKITKTMKMVSASKLRKAHQAQASAKQYAGKLTDLITRLALSVETVTHPLLKVRPKTEKILILVFSSDRGLCGSFNNSLIRQTLAWINQNRSQFSQIDMSFCGKRGFMFFRKLGNLKKNYENVTANPKFSEAIKIGEELSKSFIAGEYDAIYIAHNQFLSPLSQKAVFQKILPIEASQVIKAEQKKQRINYIFEPEAAELFNTLIPHYLYFKIYFSLLENSAGEHGARMTAMDNATKNASELIDRYTLLRNRVRQASITKELLEIVAGAEALK